MKSKKGFSLNAFQACDDFSYSYERKCEKRETRGNYSLNKQGDLVPSQKGLDDQSTRIASTTNAPATKCSPKFRNMTARPIMEARTRTENVISLVSRMHTMHLQIPPGMVDQIIGKNLEKIEALEKKYRIKVWPSQPNPNDERQTLHLQGKESSVDAAITELSMSIRDFENQQLK